MMDIAPKNSTIGMHLKVIAAAIVATSVASAAHAATVYDTALAAPGVYLGSGNANEGFTVNISNGVELGLGVQYRKTGPQVHPTSTNVYHVNTGFYAGPPADFCFGVCARWNFEFSVNLQASTPNAGLHLSDITPTITIFNVGHGQTVSFNPLIFSNDVWDGTSENTGTLATNFGFQNSHNLSFYLPPFGPPNPLFAFDPNENNTYIILLTVLGPEGAELGSVSETVVAGTGAAPLPGALPMFAAGLGVIGLLARRRKKKTLAAVSA